MAQSLGLVDYSCGESDVELNSIDESGEKMSAKSSNHVGFLDKVELNGGFKENIKIKEETDEVTMNNFNDICKREEGIEREEDPSFQNVLVKVENQEKPVRKWIKTEWTENTKNLLISDLDNAPCSSVGNMIQTEVTSEDVKISSDLHADIKQESNITGESCMTSSTSLMSDLNGNESQVIIKTEPNIDMEECHDENVPFCDMSDLAYVADIVASSLNGNVAVSSAQKKDVGQGEHRSEYEDLLQRASMQLGKKLESIDSDSSGTADSSESSSSLSSSSSSSSESSDEEENIKIREIIENLEEEPVHANPPKTKDEILPEDLPEEPELKVDLPSDALLSPVGELQSFVENMIVIKGLKDSPVLDAETILFKKDRKPFGKIFDVFGPVQSPFYVIRVNKQETFDSFEISFGDIVFYAPNFVNVTNYVFLAQLKKMKGSDASWNHDQEPPSGCMEYSDDEEESKAKSAAKKKRQLERKKLQNDDQDADAEDEIDDKDSQRHKKQNKGHMKKQHMMVHDEKMPQNQNAMQMGGVATSFNNRQFPNMNRFNGPPPPFHPSQLPTRPSHFNGPPPRHGEGFFGANEHNSFRSAHQGFQNHPDHNGQHFGVGPPRFPPAGSHHEQYQPPPHGYQFPPMPNQSPAMFDPGLPPPFPSHIPPPNWRPRF